MTKVETVTVTDKETGNVLEYTQEAFIEKRNSTLKAWEVSKLELEAAKEREMKLRKEFVDLASDADKKKGTENIQLGGGYKAKVVKKLTYGFVKKDDGKTTDKDAIETALEEIEAEGAVGQLIAERLVKWTPSLAIKEYDLLCPAHKEAIDAVLITKEGAPTLSIVAPKSK